MSRDRARCAVVSEPAAAPKQRLIFLDAARAVAIVLMVFAHFTDQLLAPALHQGPFGTAYAATRGFTAPLFFVLSGWAFAVSLLPGVARGDVDYGRRVRRGGLLLLWGYLLTLPYWAEGFPFAVEAKVWTPFFTAGVLQTLGVALLIATGLLWAVRKPQVFVGVSAVLALVTVASARWALKFAAAWPEPIRGYFDPQDVGGGFPLVPWAAFFFAGLAIGGGLWLRKAKPLLTLFVLSALSFAAMALLHGPEALLLKRFGWVLALVGVAAVGLSNAQRLPAAVKLLGQHALTFYVVHMLVLWGIPRVPGLVYRLGPSLGWGGCFALSAACLALTAAGIAIASGEPMRRTSAERAG